jgi:hypothetical protein
MSAEAARLNSHRTVDNAILAVDRRLSSRTLGLTRQSDAFLTGAGLPAVALSLELTGSAIRLMFSVD